MENIYFKCQIESGFIFKTIIDIVNQANARIVFIIDKEGIHINQFNDIETILYNIEMSRTGCTKYDYKYPEDVFIISMNSKDFKDEFTSIKKKETLVITIDDVYINFSIVTEKSSEKISIKYTIDKDYAARDLPMQDENGEAVYGYSNNVACSSLAKIKGILKHSNEIIVELQDEYFALKTPPTSSNLVKKVQTYGNKDDNKNVFSATYSREHMSCLQQLQNICKLIQLYAPQIPRYPLYIRGQTNSAFATIDIFIKDVEQTLYESSIQNEGAVVETKSSKPTKYKKKK